METNQPKQEILRDIICAFAKTLYDDLDEYIDLIKPIYDGEFRHSYSDITAILIALNQKDEDAIRNISQNLLGVIDGFTEEDDKETYRSLNKLYDHIVLEQIRLCQVYKESKELTNEAKGLIEEAKKSIEEAKNANSRANKAIREASKLKLEVITILGIFAAIVMSFMGGIAFSTSVLENIHKASIYRIIISIIGIGCILVNGIYFLTEFLRSINGVDEKDEKTILSKPICIFNAFLIFFVFLTCVAMKYHWLSQEFYHVVEFISRT